MEDDVAVFETRGQKLDRIGRELAELLEKLHDIGELAMAATHVLNV